MTIATKAALVLAVAVVTSLGITRNARAQLATFDGTNLIQNTTTAIKTVQQVRELINQGKQLNDQINNQLKQIQSLDPHTLNDLMNLVDQSRLSYAQLTNNVDGIKYSLGQVDSSFKSAFPRDRDMKRARYSDFDPMYAGWQGETLAAAQTAYRAQSSLITVEDNAKATKRILDASPGADGEVRQLQLVLQMLGQMTSQLNSVIQTLDTNGRVLASMAAGSASEKIMVRERKSRRIDGYTNPGAPPRKLQKLP